MKKIISLLVVVILLTVTGVSNNTVYAQEQTYFEVSNVEGECGEQISVDVSIVNSPGFGGMAYDVTYDNSALKLVSYSLGLGSNICTDSGVDTYSDKVNFQYAGTSNIEGDGVLVTFIFEIIGTGDSNITVVPEEGTTFYYENRTEIDFTLRNAMGTVTIKEKNVPVTGVSVDKTLALNSGESKKINYTLTPEGATNKVVSFKSDNDAVAIVNETTGVVTAIKEGNANITITTVDGNFTDTCVVTVSCAHSSKTDVKEKESDCKTKGWDSYMKCNDCGQLLARDGITEIEDIPFRPISQEHVGGNATCVKKAVCTVCNCEYGDVAAHNFATALSSDSNGHWYDCQTSGCSVKSQFSAHIPDHQGGATEEYDIKCTICQYEMEVFDELDVPGVGDNNMMLWLIVMVFSSGCSIVSTIVSVKNKCIE